MAADFRHKADNMMSSVRATALIVRDSQIFLTKDSNNRYYPIGGAVQVGEITTSAVSRETTEELGVNVSLDKLAFVIENYFLDDGVYWHNIEFHYIVSAMEETGWQLLEGSKVQACEWVDLDKLEEIDLVPEFLKTELPNWDGQLKHIINQ